METIKTSKSCLCGTSDYLVLACSGACDLGQVTDLVARKLRDTNVRKMGCLSMVSADIRPSIEAFKLANLLLLDGCAIDCGKKILENAGITNYQYLRMTDLGYVKGQTPATQTVVDAVCAQAEVIC